MWVHVSTMFLVALVIHICFLLSVFDIYFKSPIVKNVVPYRPIHKAPADRLVLFMVDGLRAENFVNHSSMPYLRSIANTHGRWGISHTHVPTESRPGHIAVISGFYEDPSSVAKGWKENPVDFDSVLNQTTYSWCWGTYDIVDIFTKGNNTDHIFPQTFDPYSESFSAHKNSTIVDAWVFDSATKFFQNVSTNATAMEMLNKDKIVFLLHLWGTDASGHKYEPGSKNFSSHIKFVDDGVQRMESVYRKFYNNDGKTTFIMTSDHGMTDWGSHGSGDDHETHTPYVIWGAGVRKISGNQTDPATEGMSSERRLDIEQADLAPLMATVLSIPVPVNNIGQLAAGLLNMTIDQKAKALYSNARQLASQYEKKQSEVEKNAIKIFYYPYKPFNKNTFAIKLQLAEKLLQEYDYKSLILLSQEIMNLSTSGLDYYHNYYQTMLLVLTTFSLIAWILCLLKVLAKQKTDHADETWSFYKVNFKKLIDFDYKQHSGLNVLFAVLFIASFGFVLAQKLPLVYYIYFLTPIVLWWYCLSSYKIWLQTYQDMIIKGPSKVLVQMLCYTLGSISLALSFSHRWMLSIPLLGMGIWPYFSSKKHQLSKSNLITWSISCAILSIFTFLPVVGKKSLLSLVIVAGVIRLVCVLPYIKNLLLPLYKMKYVSRREIDLTVTQILLRLITLHIVYVQSERYEKGTRLSIFLQSTAWIIAALSLIMPLFHSKIMICRLFAINSSIFNFYLLLSVSHEGLFMVTLMYNTSMWIFIELKMIYPNMTGKQLLELSFIKTKPESVNGLHKARNIGSEDYRRAFFFMTYIIVAFFGTGNVASLNSFKVRWVICFLTSYKPFIITTLILLKTLAPFLIVACSFRAIQFLVKAPTGYLIIIVLLYSNIMAVLLFYCVKNTGSWQEIGSSLAHYVIVQVITIFIVCVMQVAKVLTGVRINLRM